jgi:hypothetical protein
MERPPALGKPTHQLWGKLKGEDMAMSPVLVESVAAEILANLTREFVRGNNPNNITDLRLARIVA